MEGLLTNQFGELGIIIAVGILILVLFIVIRFFKMIFSSKMGITRIEKLMARIQ